MPGGRDSYFMIDIVNDGDGPSIHAVTPRQVLVVQDADQLQEMLTAFEDPVKNKAIKNTAKDRRNYVEKILPALRWYCSKFGVEQPEWLVSNNHWETMTKQEKEQLFGSGDLKLREFMPVSCPDIQVVREDEEGAQQ